MDAMDARGAEQQPDDMDILVDGGGPLRISLLFAKKWSRPSGADRAPLPAASTAHLS